MLRPVGGGGSGGAFLLATYWLSGRARRCANEHRAGGGEGWAGRGGKGVSDARRRVRHARWSPGSSCRVRQSRARLGRVEARRHDRHRHLVPVGFVNRRAEDNCQREGPHVGHE